MEDSDVSVPEARLRSAELELERLRELERAVRESSREQRRAAHEALLAADARFHHLVEAVTDYAIFMLDADGRVLTWNAEAQRTGYAPGVRAGYQEHFAKPVEASALLEAVRTWTRSRLQ